MTGEVTLRGRVLPVGGIKSKVLAAHRAGVTRVILPELNRADYAEVPESVQQQLEVVWATDMGDVLNAALEALPEELSEFGTDAEGTFPAESGPVDPSGVH
jgi:ATP-dependent Lon protease